MSPRELGLWGEHLQKFPLDEDRRLHHIVAQIWVILMYWSGAAKKGKDVSIYDVAPWLRTEQERKKAETQKRQAYVTDQYSRYLQSLGITDLEISVDEG